MSKAQRSSRRPTSKAAWIKASDRGPHLATLPSGVVVRFLIPDSGTLLRSGKLPEELQEIAILAAGHPDGPDGLMADLVTAATFSAERAERLQKAIKDGIELTHFLISDMLVEPEVSAEEVASGLLPELDIRMLLEFAERRRNEDAEGVKLPIIVLGEWATFRRERAGTEGAANGGGEAELDPGALPEPDGDAL